MDQDVVEVHKLAKKERGQYPAILTAQTWSIKDLLYGFWGNEVDSLVCEMRQRPYVTKVAKQHGISSRHVDVTTFVALVRAVVWLDEKNRALSESFNDDLPKNRGTFPS